MGKKVKKTLAMRVLEGQRVPYEVIEFSSEIHDAAGVAQVAGVPPDHVYKTLVARVDEPGFKPMLVMIAADATLDLKKLAEAVGAKKARMAAHTEAEKLTGLQTGGISALALLNRGFDVYIDEAAPALPFIIVSAGQRGLNLRLEPAALIEVTGAQIADVSKRSEESGESEGWS
ncbi:MAG TPA: aminoacyl-tRNA deacylase [Aggregatilineales bacterium]|nr:aminoacyl-tRNA deacylase [Aggregatilineales bacterium]